MTTHARQHVASKALDWKGGEQIAFRLIYVTAFVMFLAIALVGGTLGMEWRSWLPGAEGIRSVTGGVKAAVYTFMSHLS